jgi:hypothetical protein
MLMASLWLIKGLKAELVKILTVVEEALKAKQLLQACSKEVANCPN